MTALTALFVVPWTGMFRCPLLLPLTALFAFVACIIKHNHIHCRTFTTPGWNALFNLWISVATGQPATGIITVHNERHHGHMNSVDDFVRTSLVRSRSNVVNFLLFASRSVAAMYREKPSDLKLWRRRAPRLHRQALMERTLVYGVAIVLLVADWRATLLYVGMPWLFGQWALVTLNLLQHQDCDHGSEYDHSRNLTGRLNNWFFLNNGFHTAHHLRPGLHWSQLREMHERLIAPRMAPDLNERSLCIALWRRLRARPAERFSR